MNDHPPKAPTTATPAATSLTRAAPKLPGGPRGPRSKLLGEQLRLAQVDPDARRKAAAVLEVLAGLRSADQAARSLDVSLPTYFNLETRALRGLLFACTPHPPGRRQATDRKLRDAEARAEELGRQLQRYQALLRVAQNGFGLTPPTTTAKDVAPSPGKRRRRKPAVRATRVIRLLQQQQQGQPAASGGAAAAATTATPGGVVARGA